MANSFKNIVITPNIGSITEDPKIVFSSANSTSNTGNISLMVYPTSNGTLSFEGGVGQLFSISNTLSGTIFSVNDISGIPSIEVLDTGEIRMAQYGGNVNIYSTLSADVIIANTLSTVTADVVFINNIPTVLNDISNQFDGTNCVFQLRNDQSNVVNIVDSKNIEVVVGGLRLTPYVKDLRYPWITPYDSHRGFRIVSSNVSSQLIIYNAPDIGEQASITIINSSQAPQTRKYPYSAATIALGD